MALEIERKFLVHQALLPELKQGMNFIQGYLSEKPSVRFRIIEDMMCITVKDYISGGERFELETPQAEVTPQEILKLIELAVCPPIIKERFKIRQEDVTWEIDVYHADNEGLITVDVEIPHKDYPISFPAWVNTEREITEDSRYSNINLGRNPYSQWKK
jgi:CYTH domain-containing protein